MRTSIACPLVLALTLAACGSDSPQPGTTTSRTVELIKRSPYPRLVLEIDSAPGWGPRDSSLTTLTAGLLRILDKPGGVEAIRDGALTSRGPGYAWTFSELDGLARSTFDLGVPGDTTKLHVLFLDGHSADDTAQGKILGLAWAQTHLVMFKQTIEDTCAAAGVGPLLRERFCSAAEESVWTHEVGHLIGLVDNGLKMAAPHRDPVADHGAHDQSDQCVMYWAYEGEGVIGLLQTRFGSGNQESLGFDAACIADINAVKNAP